MIHPSDVRSKTTLLLAAILLAAAAASRAAAAPWVAGYYAGWEQAQLPIAGVDLSAMDALIDFAVVPRADGSLDNGTVNEMNLNMAARVAAVHAAGKKILFTVGGAGAYAAFQGAMSAANQGAFVANIADFMTANGYDGVDLDMEPMAAVDVVPYVAFAKALRARLTAVKPGALLTAAVTWEPSAFAQLTGTFDHIDLMTYSMTGGTWYNETWHDSPVYSAPANGGGTMASVDSMVKQFTAAGVPAANLGIGVTFDPYIWTGGSGVTGPRQTWTGAPTVTETRYSIVAKQYGLVEGGTAASAGAVYGWDSAAQASYLSVSGSPASADAFISYDDVSAINAKFAYAKANGVGSVIVWDLAGGWRGDLPAGQQGKLLAAVKSAAYGAAAGGTTGGTSYYVATTGSDSNPGTSSSPFLTIQKAVNAVSAGDTIIVENGTYAYTGSSGGTLVNIGKAGTSSSWITLEARNPGQVFLNGSGALGGYGIAFGSGSAYWIIKGFDIGYFYNMGIFSNSGGGNNTQILDNKIHNIGGTGNTTDIGVCGVYTDAGSANWTINGNVFHDVGRLVNGINGSHDHSLYLHGTNMIVSNNVFYNVANGWHVQIAAGFGGYIENNTFFGPDQYPGKVGQIMLWDADVSVRVANNIFYGPNGDAITAYQASFSGGCTIDHNIVYNASGSVGLIDSLPATCTQSNNLLNANPMLATPSVSPYSNSNFLLRSGSPAVGAGATLSPQVVSDFNGALRPQGAAYDLGAFEYAGAAPVAPPAITAVAATGVGAAAATIVWTTDEAADSQVVYGLTSAYGSATTLGAALTTSHSASLSGLTAGATYHYAVKSRDASGGLTASPDAAFATAASAAPPVQSSPFINNFSSSTLNACFADGSSFGPWTSAFSGYGCNEVKTDGARFWLDVSPFASASSSETHASLVLGPAYAAPLTFSGNVFTSAQLRKNAPPNPWEVGWVLWDYSDDDHFYYFQAKPNGWELGKEDPAYPGSQRFLATGTSPSFPIGAWYIVKVVQVQNVITVYVNGQLITTFTDTQSPYTGGSVGLYAEDAETRFANVAINAPGSSAPSVAVSVPAAVASVAAVSGTTIVRASTSNDADAALVLFLLDGAPLGSALNAAPFSYAWNTAAYADGAHSLSAIVWDAEGDSSVSAAVPIVVANSGAAAAPADQAKAPQKFLSPALPDGINDAATFGLGAAEVNIYNLRGRLIFHGSQQGAAPIVWNGKDGLGRVRESGVYIARIRTKDAGVLYQSFALVK